MCATSMASSLLFALVGVLELVVAWKELTPFFSDTLDLVFFCVEAAKLLV